MKNNPIDKIRDLLAEPAARRKAVICAGVVAVLAIGGAGIVIASNRPEPTDSSPSAVEKTETDGDKASGAESVAPADIAKICPTLTLDGQDVGAPADELTVTTGQGRVLVTQRAGDDAAATVDSTARRSAALARSLDGCETGGKTVETVTWAAIDEGGNVEVAVTNSPASAPSGGTTADVVNGSGGHVISDGVWSSDGVHDSGYEQNAGTVTDSAGGKIEAGSKTETDESDKKDSGKAYETKADDSGSKADSKKSDSKGSTASQASGDSQSSGSSSAQSQKKWVPEQGHWETDYGQVWVPNVVYVRHERYWVNHGGTKVGPFDSKAAAWSWCDNDVDNGGIGGSVIDDSYTTSEDQGHYEQQATGRHWVVDVAGHWE
ncbi:hypothetical protein [Gordonibacter urolithinfaciens]|uniref:hypothetical protein n=1 Tax=Gordonibacter urolithinfaciens TaxID=1335613 RepID=UPI001D06DBBA|nr:hypothetical protein [Gordonibacter urolithinfaciens]MCB7084336.1 hypothetical protein [Gordonibacter urolithinfaciens]